MNRFYKVIGIGLLLLLVCYNISKAQKDSRAFQFLYTPSSALGLSLGGVTVSTIANEPLLAMDNPALFGDEHNNQLSLSYMNYLGVAHYGSLFYCRSYSRLRSWGVGVKFLNNGQIQGRDIYGNKTNPYTANDISIQGSLSYELSDYVRAGISIKGLYSNISEYNMFGIGVDLGLNYYNENKDTSIGICLLNAGGVIKEYNKNTEYMPWDIRLGISQRLAHAPFLINLSIYDLHREREFIVKRSTFQKVIRHLTFGLEFIPNNQFYIALGYNPKVAQDMNYILSSKLSGITSGLGFMTSRYRFAFSTMSVGKSNYTLMASFSWDFRDIYRSL